jgi:antitoxin (DNA-binding transcriptional repressor) of toxin-antitoxin stability system
MLFRCVYRAAIMPHLTIFTVCGMMGYYVVGTAAMKYEHIPAGQFKTHCLELVNNISLKKSAYIITKRGVPVARMLPAEDQAPEQLFGWLSNSIVEVTDIVEPTQTSWEASDD